MTALEQRPKTTANPLTSVTTKANSGITGKRKIYFIFGRTLPHLLSFV
ncbi:hypothetical protein WN944_013812 [Citrus x changshan-huyou]|uniref:Uncharacterized protein n=1 Tax=Citrus x changshan-huyou TaxID=2935761 RepID=A0AAP0M8S8_9ROSI